MSQSQNGRAAAQARRQAQLGGASSSPTASSSQPSQRRAAKQAPAQAPIPTRAEQGAQKAAPVAPAASAASSRPRAQVITQPVAVAEGRDAAKKRRTAQMKGNRGTVKVQQKSSENPHPKAKAFQNRVNAQSAKAEQSAQAAAPESKAVSTQSLVVSAAKKENTVTGKPVVVAEGREAAFKRRQTQLRGNSGYKKQTSENPHPKAKAMQARAEAKAEAQVETAPAKMEVAPKALTTTRSDSRRNEVKVSAPMTNANPSRGMSRAYRKARTQGKAAESAYKTKGSQSGAVARMNNPEASSRDIARTVRTERCSRGKTCGTAQNSNINRTRKKPDTAAPEKVGHSTTLKGQGISGTLVGQGSMTGAEFGACQTVSGTEYLSSEEFNTHCGSTPEAGKAKVTRTQTTRGETISGTAVGNAKAVTGDRAGACTALTGTEYLPADQTEAFCGTKSDAPAKKVTGFSIDASQIDSAQGVKVTGGDIYKSSSVSIKPNKSAPEKVVASNTASGNQTTGTQVGRIEDVTGDERGYCSSVTGTGYQGVEEAETFCGTQLEAAPKKVTVSGSNSGQKITGDRSGDIGGMTGAESGTCQAVTGSSYMSAEHSSSCGTKAKAEIQHRTMGSVMPGKQALTGAQPGPEGLTGAQKGACEFISGTPYQGAGQTAAVCGGQASASQPGESDFPQMMNATVPAAPVSAAQMMLAPVVASPVVAPAGEAPQQGARITGDGWDRGAKITGTEGESVTNRNASYGGGKAPAPMAGAHGFRPNAMPEVAQSPITGSSGNTETGAKVTLTGGARA